MLGASAGVQEKSVKTFIQARTTSTRLPSKIYKEVEGVSILKHCINAAKASKFAGEVIVISPHEIELPGGITNFIVKQNENDVLSRYVAAAAEFPCDYLVRLTSDCPLLDPYLIDFVIANTIGYDYGSNVLVCTFPDGLDVEVISSKTLKMLHDKAKSAFDREHVTTYLRNNADVQKDLKLVDIQSVADYSPIKVSVDTQEDFDFVTDFAKQIHK